MNTFKVTLDILIKAECEEAVRDAITDAIRPLLQASVSQVMRCDVREAVMGKVHD